MSPLIYQLQAFKDHNNFPSAAWERRGLNPSDEATRQGMNLIVIEFADFLINKIYTGVIEPAALQEVIQNYFDEHDDDDFDTEEREYIRVVQCKLIQLVGVDCGSLFI